MIKRFGFRNFSSFKDGTEVNFSCKENAVDEENKNLKLAKVMGIKGANGSGKTNILKAFAFLYCFCVKRMKTTTETSEAKSKIVIPLSTFMNNQECAEFYIEFLAANGAIYYYELDITRSGIIREEIRRKYKKEVTCISRSGNKITECLKEFNELKNLKLKSDQSLISIINDFDFNSSMIDLKIMHAHFLKVLFNVGVDGYQNIEPSDYLEIAEFYKDNNEAFEFTKKIISSVDDGITNITIEETKDKSTGKTFFFPMFVHQIDERGFSIGVPDESMGTRALFLMLSKYWVAIETGGLLILDEFDTHLHAMILPEIIELFTNPKINKKNAQLIITAHNTEIIDSLGRYNTILVNKENNESYSYRLDEISLLRNDRLISPIYNKGRIGGTPKNIRGIASRIAEELSTDV